MTSRDNYLSNRRISQDTDTGLVEVIIYLTANGLVRTQIQD